MQLTDCGQPISTQPNIRPALSDFSNLAPMWPWYGPDVALIWPRCGPDMAPMWPWYGPDVALIWPRCGTDLAPMWPWSGPDVALIWPRSGLDMAPMWPWSGPDMDLIWLLYGPDVALICPWHILGKLSKCLGKWKKLCVTFLWQKVQRSQEVEF